ncbi:twin arginine translocase protein A [Botrimarina hoheduenensis]|uniref:Sec-independent protein translocase protein TatA n=2 Tax=Botrimarina hoheduenensis TaxID=2528000 RepID=A0A5C5WAZ1_9BACT|nr:twin arginine translocase protein A [Botrimarina hoheduenensis]
MSPMELLIVGVVAVLLFGSKLPSVARSAGKSLTEFKRGMRDMQDEFHRTVQAADLEESARKRMGDQSATPTASPDPDDLIAESGAQGAAVSPPTGPAKV